MVDVPETTWRLILYILAAAGVGGGIVLLWHGRRSAGLKPTRMLAALSLGVLGYHAAAYASPAAWFPIQIPRDRLWLTLLLIGAGLVISVWLDRRQLSAPSKVSGPDEEENP